VPPSDDIARDGRLPHRRTQRGLAPAGLPFATVALLVALASIATACHSAPPPPKIIGPTAVRIHGPIHTQGPLIVDATGATVRFNGVGIRDYVSVGNAGGGVPSGGPCVTAPPQREVDDIVNWGFNSVRIPLAWANLEPTAPAAGPGGALTHAWDAAYLANLDGFVQRVTARGIAVFFTIHTKFGSSTDKGPCNLASLPSWMYPAGITDPAQARCDFLNGTTQPGAPETIWDGYEAMWTMLASRYASNLQVVAADLVNEPYPAAPCGPGATKLTALYGRLGATVRAADPNLALILEDAPPGLAMAGKFEIDEPPTTPDTIYSFHLYQANWEPDGKAVNDAYAARARTWNVPLLVGEFNAFGYAAPGAGYDSNWQADTQAAVSYWRGNAISWMAWAYSGGNHLVNKDGSPRADLISAFQKGF
jgi:hypothetical protein